MSGNGTKDGNEVVVVVTATTRPDGGDAMMRYRAAAGPIMVRHGGRPLQELKPIADFSGNAVPSLVVLMGFPSRDACVAAFDDPEYVALQPLRNAAFTSLSILLARPPAAA